MRTRPRARHVGVLGRRRTRSRGAVRNAVDDDLDARGYGHKPEDRGDALERERVDDGGGARDRGKWMRGGPVTDSRHRQGVIAHGQRHRSRGRHAVAVEHDFGVGGSDQQAQFGHAGLEHLVEHGDDARRQLAGEHVGRVGLEQRHKIRARLGFLAKAKQRAGAHVVGRRHQPSHFRRGPRLDGANRRVERLHGVLVIQLLE